MTHPNHLSHFKKSFLMYELLFYSFSLFSQNSCLTIALAGMSGCTKGSPIWENEQENRSHMTSPKSFNRDSQRGFPATTLPSYPWQTNPHQESPIYTLGMMQSFRSSSCNENSCNKSQRIIITLPTAAKKGEKFGIVPNQCL